MQISISGQGMEVTPALHDNVAEKIEKIERHFDHVTNIHVVLHVEKMRHRAEATINTKGATLHASATAENMYAAIDSMISKLDRQIIKHKEKLSNHHRNKEATQSMPE